MTFDVIVNSAVYEGDVFVFINMNMTHDENLEAGCKQALKQIEDKNYVQELQELGLNHILKFGIACYKKRCKVISLMEK
ncbi:hypothetical protein PMF13cell1_00095 [Blautia producta]|uniref:Uncharacterized protein n=1 Tax=Blautia producta TaxID=33035 RepID=A0A4P6LS11_9FIRM|nr:hypothetical protein PMF13cell1_00095 [Blautia producta]